MILGTPLEIWWHPTNQIEQWLRCTWSSGMDLTWISASPPYLPTTVGVVFLFFLNQKIIQKNLLRKMMFENLHPQKSPPFSFCSPRHTMEFCDRKFNGLGFALRTKPVAPGAAVATAGCAGWAVGLETTATGAGTEGLEADSSAAFCRESWWKTQKEKPNMWCAKNYQKLRYKIRSVCRKIEVHQFLGLKLTHVTTIIIFPF